VPVIFSHIGQIHNAFKSFIKKQISQKLISTEGRAEKSKITSTMKWWSQCLSMMIARTASRSVNLKVSTTKESLIAAQSADLTREAPELSVIYHR